MLKAIKNHWPEYLMEAWGLGTFMVAACIGTTVLWHADSPIEHLVGGRPYLQRMLMGIAMGLTAIGIVYSPWGKRSGAHINPALTLTFLRLGKIKPWEVSDTNEALKFYRDFLGLKVAGESENYGSEQERLNNVFGARLRITGLRAAKGPGIELLEYLAPSSGSPYPVATKMNDLWSWRTRLVVQDIDAAMKASKESHVDWVSPGVVDIVDDEIGIDYGMTVSGPFGHRMILVDPKE